MTDTPKNEEAILNKLINIRDKLSVLKMDRTKYLNSSDVWEMYGQLTEEIRKLLDIRSDPLLKDEQNRVDVVLEDVFQLVSLTFLTVGITNKAPATFASLCTVKRILYHIKDSTTYTENDVAPIKERLNEIASIVDRDTGDEAPEIIHIMKQKLERCQVLLEKVQENIDNISPELTPILQKLVYIRREIMSIGSKPHHSPSNFKVLLEELRKIENDKVDGHFYVRPDGSIPNGESTLNGILEKCHSLIDDFSAKEEHVDPGLKAVYAQLVEMKSTLEGLLVTHRWTLRETDLYYYQKKLQEIDDLRVNGVFRSPGSDPSSIPKGQSVLLYLLRRCYAIIYKLLESSEPVSDALTPIHNQLSTTRRCLLEVKKMGGLSSIRELYPYQMKLASIDNLRVDGKFLVGDTIPEGQGMLNALLAECFDICHELKVEMEENEPKSENGKEETD
jgi:Protein of unknown function (DUF2408)